MERQNYLVTSLVIDPDHPNTLHANGDDVLRSTDGGSNLEFSSRRVDYVFREYARNRSKRHKDGYADTAEDICNHFLAGRAGWLAIFCVRVTDQRPSQPDQLLFCK